MSLAQFLPNLPVVVVNSDWTDPANAMADLERAWGVDFGTVHTFSIGMATAPLSAADYGALAITTGTPTWGTAFDAIPAEGTYIYCNPL